MKIEEGGVGGIPPEILRDLVALFEEYPEIKLVYLFGSRATGKTSPLSDYDFAVYLDTSDVKRMHDIRFELYDRIGRLLKEDNIDIVILNLVESPEFKYFVIRDGKRLFEREPFRVLVEPRILNEYFDFQILLRRYNLTRAKP
ncbi:MAG: type VII toxin-antitoxin system MntA family adenylyltransferase antitoxin [Candidatus Caldatribacteriaceae bacterium]